AWVTGRVAQADSSAPHGARLPGRLGTFDPAPSSGSSSDWQVANTSIPAVPHALIDAWGIRAARARACRRVDRPPPRVGVEAEGVAVPGPSYLSPRPSTMLPGQSQQSQQSQQ